MPPSKDPERLVAATHVPPPTSIALVRAEGLYSCRANFAAGTRASIQNCWRLGRWSVQSKQGPCPCTDTPSSTGPTPPSDAQAVCDRGHAQTIRAGFMDTGTWMKQVGTVSTKCLWMTCMPTLDYHPSHTASNQLVM